MFYTVNASVHKRKPFDFMRCDNDDALPEIQFFDNYEEADEWEMEHARSNGWTYRMIDFG
jgi:hypothetical protein